MAFTRQSWRLVVAVAAGIIAAASSLRAQDPRPAGTAQPTTVLFDGFDKKLRLNWQTIRPDPIAVSLDSHPGHLTLTTKAGTIHRKNGPTAKNIFVIDNPLAADADFEVTTRIASFKPSESYHQCALICYDDDDNYLKWTLLYDPEQAAGYALSCVRETDAMSEIAHFPPPDKSKGLWLRIVRHGDSYDCQSSGDGQTFAHHGQFEWKSKNGPKKLGILAKNGGITVSSEIEAVFDFFELRSVP